MQNLQRVLDKMLIYLQLDLELDLNVREFNIKIKGYSMVVEDGKVIQLNSETSPVDLSISSSISTLKEIQKLL
jgi:peroxiredoxin